MYRAFVKESFVGPLTATFPAFFAKSYLIWPALLNLFGNADIRNKLAFFNFNGKRKKNHLAETRTTYVIEKTFFLIMVLNRV